MRLGVRVGIGAGLALAWLGMSASSARATAFPGPDDYGYRALWIQGAELIDIRAAGHAVSLSDDQLSTAISIGFTFDFYGVNYTQAYISSNGVLSFSGSSGTMCCSGHSMPTASHPYPLIGGFWTDLYPPDMGWIYYDTIGTAPNREFVVAFHDVAEIGTGRSARATFEIILHEGTNDIELIYDRPQIGHLTVGAGIQNSSGTVGLEIDYMESANFATGDVVFGHAGFLITTGMLPSCKGLPVSIMGMPGPGMLVGTDGDDVILGGDDADAIMAGLGNDVICGGGGDDSLDGGEGNDIILGGGGNDTLRGAAGKDRLNGGAGTDVCDGGGGRDRAQGCEMKRGVE